MKQRYQWLFRIVIFIFFYPEIAWGQYMYGTTGLLQMPTAEMQKDKTFMFGGSILNPETLPSKEWWGNYYTLNYYLNITMFPWLEVGYNCVLVKGKPGIYHWPEQTYGKFVNQDRSFHGRLRLWKEGWWKEWTPQIVIGLNDPATGSWEAGSSSDKQLYNGFFCRYYVAATKHIEFAGYGTLGGHIAYIYNRKEINHLNGPALGVSYRFCHSGISFLNKILNGVSLMAEYDSCTINCGLKYSFWKDYINAVVEMTECRHVSGGLAFKLHLK